MKHKVLIVEDEQDTADLLKRILEREGFSVLQAKDGRQASTLIGTVRPPSLVLLDLVLPYVSGSELLKAIRTHPDWQHTPIIVLSADSHEPDIQRVLSSGATAYVLKQKGAKVLLQEMHRIIPTSEPSTVAPSRIAIKKTATAPDSRHTAVRHRPHRRRPRKRAT